MNTDSQIPSPSSSLCLIITQRFGKKEKETENELCLQASISSSMSSEATPRSREKLIGFMTFPLLPIATKIQRSKINKIKLTKPLYHKFVVPFIYIA